MTPNRTNAIGVLRELRDALNIPQKPMNHDTSANTNTLNALIYILHGKRHLVSDELAHRAEQAIADMRLEQGG